MLDFAPVPFDEIAAETRRHLASLPAAIESFLEKHILASTHYRMLIAGEPAGFASIHDGRLITQFALSAPWRRHGQALFAQVRRLEQVQAAFVPTCDEFFLAHALDDFRVLRKQAYFFATSPQPAQPPPGFALRAAEPADAALIRRESGDFLDRVEEQIAAGEIFVVWRGDETVGLGALERSVLYENVASIGMFTRERYRRQGVGTATIALLIARCRDHGLRPVAGCWYYNHASKRTLERAGLYAGTRLLRIAY